MNSKLNFSDPDLIENLNHFGSRTIKRILGNFDTLNVSSPHNQKWSSSGTMYRSIYWKVFNEANGDLGRVDFFFKNYAKFVETGTGAGVKYKDYPRLPALTRLEPLSRPGTSRLAKPLLMSEIRIHTRMALEHLAERYLYMGGAFLVQGLGDNNDSDGQTGTLNDLTFDEAHYIVELNSKH